MHGVMEGPGEELTVAAIASEGLEDSHHHPHLNGVGTTDLPSPPPSKPPPSPPAVTAAITSPLTPPSPSAEKKVEEEEEEEKKEEQEKEAPEVTVPASPPPPPPSAVEDEEDSSAKTPVRSPEEVERADTGADGEADTAEAVKGPTSAEVSSPPIKDGGEDKENVAQDETTSATDSKEQDKELPDANETTPEEDRSCVSEQKESSSDASQISNETVANVEVPVSGEVTVKIESDTLSTCGDVPELSEEPKEQSMEIDPHPDDEAGASSGSEASLRDAVSGDSQEERMEIDLSSTEVKVEVIEDQEKSTDSGIVSEQPSRKITQKRASEEELFNGDPKKTCLPDIVCGDANALDLSGMKKNETKEPKIALKPQSLLLSKLQGTNVVEKSKRDVFKQEDPVIKSGDAPQANKVSRRRSSRDDKDSRSHYQRRSTESNSNRVMERDQVLREMRTRVRSSYKERERAAKEDSLLRDLLEPERLTLMTDFVEAATQCGGMSELDRVSASLDAEIRQLTVEINAKEAEWNDLIRKKKLKEELALRIRRRKQVLILTGDHDDEQGRRNSLEDDSRTVSRRESTSETRQDRRHDPFREVVPKTGEELLAAALRLGSRNVEDYHHRGSSSSPLAVRIQARANELLTGSTPTLERKSSGPLPGLSHMQTQSLLQTQLTKPTEISPSSSQSQFLLQHLQRQRVLMGAVSSSGSACRLSSSVSLSAIPTSTSTSSVLNASLPSAAVQNKNLPRVDKQICAANASRMQRPILPKPSTATSGGHVVSDSSLDGSGKGIIGEGRQGPIIDVQSIIADYRSQHPENVPRRGRRMKPSGMVSDSIIASARPGSSSGGGLLSMSLPALGSGSHVRTAASGSSLHGGTPVDLSELGFVLSSGAGSDGPSRPSSTESSLSGAPSQINQDSGPGMSFKDVLVQFAKMTNANEQNSLASQGSLLGRPPPPPYPEVTLHPVVAPASIPSPAPPASTPTTSLLHGILTKSNNQSSNSNQSHAKPTTFSPTLARLLTAPERSTTSSVMNSSPANVLPSYQTSAVSTYCATGPVLLSDLLSNGSSKKARSELTITPVSASSNSMQSSSGRAKRSDDIVVLDGDDAGDDGDTDSDERRLVIDEGENGENMDVDARLDRSKNTVPHCQGCNERDAEFVCAGCQRQWYCSRGCQIAAWDEHSEQCFPASSDN